MIVWRDGVVPFAVELGAFDVDSGHVGIRYDNAAGVLAGVEFAAHGEAGFGGGGRDQLDNHAIADEWLGAPVLADEGEEGSRSSTRSLRRVCLRRGSCRTRRRTRVKPKRRGRNAP